MHLYEKSFQGRSHLKKGLPCQDRCGHCITPNGWIVAAIADGVSASPQSEVGAEIAVQSCLEYFSDFRFSPFLSEESMHRIFYDAFNYALRRVMAYQEKGAPVPYSKFTTLHVLLYGRGIGVHWGQAGDGAIILRNSDGQWVVAPGREKDEETNSPVTLQDGPDFWRFGSMDDADLESLLMITDGVADTILCSQEQNESSAEIVRLLMDPPVPDLEKELAEEYFHEIFFGVDSILEIPAPFRDSVESSLRGITDDITVLLINDLENPSARSIVAAERKNRAVDQPSQRRKGKSKGARLLRMIKQMMQYNPSRLCRWEGKNDEK